MVLGPSSKLIPVEWRRRKFIVTSLSAVNSERVDQRTIYVLESNSIAGER